MRGEEGKRLLVVEDERLLAGFLKRGLGEEGYAVDIAYDGEEGWHLTRIHAYDVIILDIMLPKVDGLTLCRQLRHQQWEAPIMLLTAKDAVEDRIIGLDMGADDYLVKPFAFAELLARIRVLLRRRWETVSAQLQVADLVLNLVHHRASRGEQPISLTPREYTLLEFLMRHAGEVVTRRQIAEYVWGQQCDSDSNVIDVYVSYLRQKIDRGFVPKLLHTVRGAGYVLKEEA